MRGRWLIWAVGVALVLPTSAFAMEAGWQQPEAEPRQQAQEAEQEESAAVGAESRYTAEDEAWKERRFHVSGFGGQMLAGTDLGLVENIFFRVQIKAGDDSLFGARFGWVFAPRFDLELEFGQSSPGLIATLTDLQGRNKTEVPFTDFKVTYLMAVVNYSMIERTRRIVPYLSLGLGTVRADSDTENVVGAREPGIIFGGGLRVRIVDLIAFRADVRGLRSGFGTKQAFEDLPGVFTSSYSASHLLWSAGLDIRF